jgi:hypothetical protein
MLEDPMQQNTSTGARSISCTADSTASTLSRKALCRRDCTLLRSILPMMSAVASSREMPS